jgi:hypothetical protein
MERGEKYQGRTCLCPRFYIDPSWAVLKFHAEKENAFYGERRKIRG